MLMAAAAQDAAAAPQQINGNNNQNQANAAPAATPIPPEVLAAQQASAAALASSVAAANEAAAATGLRQPPGLQAGAGQPGALLPLPALANGDAAAPSVVVESSTAVAVLPTEAAEQPALTAAPGAAGGLRQPPGLDADAGADTAVSLLPLPTPPSVTTSVCPVLRGSTWFVH